MLKLLKPTNPEDLFIQRYDLLMRWALGLTHSAAQAEDLVHDAFIQFTLRRSELGAIENTDAYLHRMLRNMYLSQVRRATLIDEARFSIANFDSVELGLRWIDAAEHVQVQDELRQICEYACFRKETSKAGGVLILRFFHGYYPSEIAKVLRSTRSAVDWWVKLSRREAKVYLIDPEAVRFASAQSTKKATHLGYARSTIELLAELRQTIFSARTGDCFSVDQLKEVYLAKSSNALDLPLFSHLVSCAGCLDQVNGILGLPSLAERSFGERLGRDVPPKSGDGEGGAGGSSVESKRRFQGRLKETIEHRPQELRIAVNGFVLGAQQISSEFNKQVLSVNIDEPIGFIEVFSEQGVRLLFFDVDQPTDGHIEQHARSEFDCGRKLDLSLNFRGPWPTLNVSYHDPTFEAVESGATEVALEIPLVDDSQSKIQTAPWFSLRTSSRSLLRRFDWRVFFRPGVVTAVFAVILFAVALTMLHRHPPAPPISAADLLQKAGASEAVIASNPDQVLHHVFRLEERSSAGQLISSHRVEIWHSAERDVTVRRLYDENGALIAGAWIRGDGVQTIYHHGKRPEIRLAHENLTKSLLTFDSIWQLDPSAKGFSALIGNNRLASIQERENSYVVDSGSNVSSELLKVTLVLSLSDLHATEQTLVIRKGDEVREYRFVETSFERRSLNSVAPAVFEPETTLLGEVRNESIRGATPPAIASPAPPFLATPELELQVLKDLNQVGAFYGEQISLMRSSEGRLRVQAIVETDKRKAELLQALSAVKQNPAVELQIETVEEAANRQARQRSDSENSTEVNKLQFETNNAAPAESDLRIYLSRQRGLTGDALEQETRRYADGLIAHSRQARRQALALKQIAERFSLDDLNALDQNPRNQWRAMITEHARAVQQELEDLRRELQPAFPEIVKSSNDDGFQIAGDGDLARAAKRVFELATSVDESVGRSFSIYASSSASAPIKNSQFSESLHSAIVLAGKVSH